MVANETYEQGYVYHIKDEYFIKAEDDKLMMNKEKDSMRPTFYSVKDEETGLLWFVPMSSQIEKYRIIMERQIEKRGECLGIVIGEYGGKPSAFLLQNMFPATEYYIHHKHTVHGKYVAVRPRLQKEINENMRRLKVLVKRGIKAVFTDILRLESLMLEELKG